MPLDLIITDAGRAALLNAQQTGTDAVTIAQAGLSASAISAAPAMTVLPGETVRISTIGGSATASDVIHVSMRDESAAAYTLRSFALYLDDGTLFALYGQADPILIKTAASTALIAVDCVFADVSAASLVFGATNFTDPDATTARKGLIEIATIAEALLGADGFRAITPAALAAALLPLLLARDGSGSGLDADLLDGQQGAWYADIAARLGYTPINKAGDIMTGSLGFILPQFFVGAVGGSPLIGLDSNDWLRYDRVLNRLLLGIGGIETVLWHGFNDGSGSGLDADLLDGFQAADFVALSAFTGAAILSRLLAVDGSGSGLDADLLDGQDSSFFTNIIARLGYTPINKAGDSMAGALGFDLSNFWAGASGGRPTIAFDANDYLAFDRALNRLLIGIGGIEGLLWHANNDGAGSGLDADLWRGKTPAQTIADFFSTGSNANGRWWKMPDGAGGTVIEQQGRGAATSGQQTVNIVFPTPFASTDYDLQLTAIIPGAGDYDNFLQEVSGTRTVNGVTVYAQDPSSGGDGSLSGFHWSAKGY